MSARAVLGGDLPQWIAREALQGLVEALPALESAVHKAVASHCLAALQPRLSSLEEQATLVREGLAGLHEREGDWAAAARALGGINLDSGPRAADEAYQLGLCVRAALLHLEAGDPVSAEAFVKRASFLAPGCADKGLALQYRACHARVLDSKRRFLDAAAQYYALSQPAPGESAQVVGEQELLQALASAATCTILAAAGPKRSRMLATLLRDARCRKLECWRLLEKVHTERMLEPVEVAAFARGLQEHQQATLSDGTTVLERAVAEHNLLGASKVYSEALFSDLGERLGVQADQVARLAASMIAEGRMPGLIDQVAGTIDFSGGGVGGARGPLGDWDARIKSLCSEADALLADVPLL